MSILPYKRLAQRINLM
ncbi:hypothetical protein CGLO_12595 [Colletotrichum gloeosporioides Cg-14]|uniref:Uncharacterized protein n=1 Tax=Colletotrichum gloeosporioides (strain Cg-14) TaxID=1237896 RepID=T0LJ68_COLGC|nr:hypothetical protein CGLO_12595 [Colletotrichum gloeosporioides Cg-14]